MKFVLTFAKNSRVKIKSSRLIAKNVLSRINSMLDIALGRRELAKVEDNFAMFSVVVAKKSD